MEELNNKNNKIEDGFYWVYYCGGWTIGRWSTYFDRWEIDTKLLAVQLAKIGDRIECPKE
jgi:hypothetical protein